MHEVNQKKIESAYINTQENTSEGVIYRKKNQQQKHINGKKGRKIILTMEKNRKTRQGMVHVRSHTLHPKGSINKAEKREKISHMIMIAPSENIPFGITHKI